MRPAPAKRGELGTKLARKRRRLLASGQRVEIGLGVEGIAAKLAACSVREKKRADPRADPVGRDVRRRCDNERDSVGKVLGMLELLLDPIKDLVENQHDGRIARQHGTEAVWQHTAIRSATVREQGGSQASHTCIAGECVPPQRAWEFKQVRSRSGVAMAPGPCLLESPLR